MKLGLGFPKIDQDKFWRPANRRRGLELTDKKIQKKKKRKKNQAVFLRRNVNYSFFLSFRLANLTVMFLIKILAAGP